MDIGRLIMLRKWREPSAWAIISKMLSYSWILVHVAGMRTGTQSLTLRSGLLILRVSLSEARESEFAQTHVPTEAKASPAKTRLPGPHEDARWAEGLEGAPGQGP